MSTMTRSPFHQEVVETLIASKAINFTAVGETLSKFGERAALEGNDLVHIINRRVTWACGWPGPELDIFRGAMTRELSE